MRAAPFFLATTLLLSSCSPSSLSSLFHRETYLPEDDLHELHLEIADLKHALGSQAVQIEILEEKIVTQNGTISSLKTTAGAKTPPKMEQVAQDVAILEKKIALLSKAQEQLISDVRGLTTHASQTSTALAQCKTEIQGLGENLSLASQRLSEVGKLKSTLSNLSHSFSEKNSPPVLYKVKSGDSLGKIAIDHNTSVELIRELNHLSSDRIFVGAEILIPAGSSAEH